MFDPSVRTKLLNLPLKVAHELRAVKTPTVRQALRMQMAATLDTLLHVPMRIRNPSELDPATTIIPPIDGQHRMPGNPADRATMMQALPPDGATPPSGDASAATGCGLDGSDELANSTRCSILGLACDRTRDVSGKRVSVSDVF